MAYASEADELFFGGAASGGKSALIAGLALTQHQRSLIIRRESTQLRGMIDDMARTLKTRDGLNNQAGQWRLPASVALKPDQLIEFGGVPNPGDEERHQGIAHDLLAFDEATQIPEYVIDYLSTWNRSVNPRQRCRMVLTSNPPTPSTSHNSRSNGLWLMRRYAPWLDPQYRDPCGLGPAKPGELRYFATVEGREMECPDPLPFLHEICEGPNRGKVETITPRSRTFIPSLPTDNPYTTPQYIATLQKLPEPLRSALLYGDFSVSLTDQPLQLIPTDWLRAATQRWVDLNARSPDPAHNLQMTSMGVDVARGGTDSTVVQVRYGNYFPAPERIPTALARTGPEVASTVLPLRRDACPVVIDANGVGASVYDHLRDALNQDGIKAYVGSAGTKARDKSNKFGFSNMRAQVYWRLREALDPASPQKLAIPDDPRLISDLLAITWEEVAGKIKVIAKKDLIKILGHSPDEADALTLALTVRDETQVDLVRERREARLPDVRARGTAGPGSRTHTGWRRARWSDRTLDYPRGIG
jgi:hypothetical protein